MQRYSKRKQNPNLAELQVLKEATRQKNNTKTVMTTVTENPLSILEAFDNVAKLQLYYFDKATKLPKSYQKILKKLGVSAVYLFVCTSFHQINLCLLVYQSFILPAHFICMK